MGTHYSGTKAEVRALDAYIKLMRAASAVAQRVERRLPPLGLSESQFGVLEILLHVGPLNQRGLGRKLFRSGGNITMVVDNLERRRLVRRERDATDRRHVKVHLTVEGRRLIQRIFPGHVAAIARELGVLGAGEQGELGRLCKKVGVGRGVATTRSAGPASPRQSASRPAGRTSTA